MPSQHSHDSSGLQPSPPHELALLCSRDAFETRKARRRNRERLDSEAFWFELLERFFVALFSS